MAYLLLLPGPAALAYVSGPLLLLFITGTGIALGTPAGITGDSTSAGTTRAGPREYPRD